MNAWVCVCAHVCVNKIPASKVQWPGTDENPLGESLLDVAPHSCCLLPAIFPSWQQSDGEAGGGGAYNHVIREMNRAAVPSVSHKLGSGRSHGTFSWDEQREEGRKQLFSVFLSLLHRLTSVFLRSVIFSQAVISFCRAVFFKDYFFGAIFAFM